MDFVITLFYITYFCSLYTYCFEGWHQVKGRALVINAFLNVVTQKSREKVFSHHTFFSKKMLVVYLKKKKVLIDGISSLTIGRKCKKKQKQE